jgi:cyanate permease
LAAWSTFVPVGLALGAWGHGVIADLSDWRTATLASSLAALPLMLAVFVLRERRSGPVVAAPSHRIATAPIPPAAWALAGAFGGFAALAVGVIALLPTVLVGDGLAVAAAGRWTAWASLAAVPGSLLVAFVVQRRATHRPLAAVSLLLPGLLMFVVFDPHARVVTVGVAAMVLHAALGIFGGLAFALLPAVAGSAARTAQTYGVLAQFGASGSLAGPPLLALVIEHAGWRAGAGLGCTVAVASLLLAVLALRRSG